MAWLALPGCQPGWTGRLFSLGLACWPGWHGFFWLASLGWLAWLASPGWLAGWGPWPHAPDLAHGLKGPSLEDLQAQANPKIHVTRAPGAQ